MVAIDQISDDILSNLVDFTGNQNLSLSSNLEDAVPADGVLEDWLHGIETTYGVHFTDAELAGAFSSWNVRDLSSAVSRQVTAKPMAKQANNQQERQRAHQRYMATRGIKLQQAKAYRVMHMQQLRRQAKSYRRKVKKKLHRPKQRIGSSAGGYSLIAR